MHGAKSTTFAVEMMTMRRQSPRHSPPTLSTDTSESKLHGKMRHQRETVKRILFFVLGAIFVLVLQRCFSVETSVSLQQSCKHSLKQGNIRSSNMNHDPTTTDFSVHPSFREIYDTIDNDDNHERCARYGWKYNPKQEPRRIFFGSLIADDSLDTIRIHATEACGVYDTVALIESNLTQTETVRELQYAPGSERLDYIQSGIFGPSTQVHVDYFFNSSIIVGNYTITNPMARERFQRSLIVERWKQNGMTPEDIGIVGDVDEVFSRDVLRAVQVCDVPQFRPNQDCHLPRLTAETLIFESSPECMQRGRRWIHPDMIIGQCIDGIGDPTNRPVPGRQYFGLGIRNKGWGYKGANDYYRMEDNSTGNYPLWNIADIRELGGYEYIRMNGTKEKGDHPVATATGYHFHNFFERLSTLRNKYLTYAHPHQNAMSAPISSMHEDIELMVRCVKGLPNPNRTTLVKRFLGGYDGVKGPKPIYFQANETYRLERHATVRRMLMEDERIHGTEYPQEEDDVEGNIMHF